MQNDPKVGDKVFFYGTLRRDGGRHRVVAAGVKPVENDDVVLGVLFNVHNRFPALILGDAAKHDAMPIKGEVYEIVDPHVVAAMDQYEGYPHMYLRSQVETLNGHKVWVYAFNQPVDELPVVVSGDWFRRAAA